MILSLEKCKKFVSEVFDLSGMRRFKKAEAAYHHDRGLPKYSLIKVFSPGFRKAKEIKIRKRGFCGRFTTQQNTMAKAVSENSCYERQYKRYEVLPSLFRKCGIILVGIILVIVIFNDEQFVAFKKIKIKFFV